VTETAAAKQRDRMADTAQMFRIDTEGTTLTEVREDGLYRHLKFRRPDTGLYWFDLITPAPVGTAARSTRSTGRRSFAGRAR
jgi:hypothetical protein